MNQRTNSRRCFCLSTMAETKPSRCSIQEIRGKSENLRTIEKSILIATFSPIGAPRSCERKRHYNYYDGIDGISGTTNERGGENHAR